MTAWTYVGIAVGTLAYVGWCLWGRKPDGTTMAPFTPPWRVWNFWRNW